jgi:F0F1-type ATP synthase membrane subunit b/b'
MMKKILEDRVSELEEHLEQEKETSIQRCEDNRKKFVKDLQRVILEM